MPLRRLICSTLPKDLLAAGRRFGPLPFPPKFLPFTFRRNRYFCCHRASYSRACRVQRTLWAGVAHSTTPVDTPEAPQRPPCPINHFARISGCVFPRPKHFLRYCQAAQVGFLARRPHDCPGSMGRFCDEPKSGLRECPPANVLKKLASGKSER